MRIKIILILLLTNFALFGQDSKFFVDTNKLWSVYWDYSAEGQPDDNYTYIIKFVPDTNINGHVFNNVLRSNDSLQTWFNYGFIRETADKKIYYITDNQDTVEKLIFNENANLGDTLILFDNQWPCSTYVVDSIDSVFTGSEYLKRFNPQNIWMTWIEGIGSDAGFDKYGVFNCAAGGIRELLCCSENDTLLYSSPYHSFCYHGTLGLMDNYDENTSVSLFPNPILSYSTFKLDNVPYSDNVLEIFSFTGQKIKTIRLDKQTTINKSDFSSGLYIYRLITKTKIITGKFEIE